MNRLKQPRIDSKRYRDASKHAETCAHCGEYSDTIVPAHYSGMHANKLGKGAGIRSSDLAVADLCQRCHSHFDSYADGRDEAAGFDFLMAIMVTQLRRHADGLLIVKGEK